MLVALNAELDTGIAMNRGCDNVVLRLAIAKYRLFFGFCPKCNSDAPAIDACNVCNGERSYPPSKHKKMTWLNDYKQELENERA